MESPDRESQIMYLRDISGVELLCKELTEGIEALEQDSRHCQAGLERKPLPVEKPERGEYHGDAGVCLFVLLGLVSLWAVIALSLSPLKRLCLLAAAAFWLGGAVQLWRDEEEKRGREFQKAMDRYTGQTQYNEGLKAETVKLEIQLSQDQEKIEDMKAHLEEAESLRRELYAHSWIPQDFRNPAGINYLYLLFAASYETDRDRLIHDLLPDEIQWCMEDYLCPDWHNMLTWRWEQALRKKDRISCPDREENLHHRLDRLLLKLDLE